MISKKTLSFGLQTSISISLILTAIIISNLYSMKLDSSPKTSIEDIKLNMNTNAVTKPKVSRVSSRKSCAGAIQNKIAWDYNGNKKWSSVKLNSLCGDVNSYEPVKCFNRVMHGGILRKDNAEWNYQNAINLCQQTSSASKTIACFKYQNQRLNGQQQKVIDQCKVG